MADRKDIPTTLGKRLRKLREDAILTQAEVSRRLGIPQSVISDMENDKYLNPSADQVVLLAELFTTTPRYLLYGSGEPKASTTLSDDERVLLGSYRALLSWLRNLSQP